jgi:hypothetical protein
VLYHIAIDLLAAPATTAADERVFSQSDDVINDDRPRLNDDTAEQQVVLRNWIASGLVNLMELEI